MSKIIILKDVWKIFSTPRVIALKDISLEIGRGSFVSIIGPSGSGKSTLLHLIGGLDRPTKGEIIVDNMNITKIRNDIELSKYRNTVIGFVFQMFYLVPRLNVFQNVELPLIARGLSPGERKKMAIEALKFVGMEKRLKHKPNQLSGGEQQRVAIARAIAGKPKILLADEPTGNLDSINAKNIMNLFRKMNEEIGLTIIMATHNLQLIKYCDKVIR
ncbi:MAG TPA: ABC transporter ATP-binding protein, partial [Thermoprotei archaeon]|nr:ABC transporter ATP-binding protein [Thermoprotei archaeon]